MLNKHLRIGKMKKFFTFHDTETIELKDDYDMILQFADVLLIQQHWFLTTVPTSQSTDHAIDVTTISTTANPINLHDLLSST
jgi:hypothetical protein